MLFVFFVSTVLKAQNRPVYQGPKINHRRFNMDSIERRGILTFNPTNFAASTIKAGYEIRLSHNKGLKFVGSFGATNSGANGGSIYGLDKFTEFSLEAQFRFYVLKNHPSLNGLYLAPYVFYKTMTYSDSTNYDSYLNGNPVPTAYINNAVVSAFGVGYIIGYQWIFRSTFVIDAFIGGGNNFISGNNQWGSLTSVYAYGSGINLHSGIAIGLAF